jgi:hypothetical protein
MVTRLGRFYAKQSRGKTAMLVRFLAVIASIASGMIVTIVLAQMPSSNSAQTTRSRYLPEYTASGDLVLPKNFHEWVYVGSPLTPNAVRPVSQSITTSTSNRAHTRYTRRLMNFPKGQSCSRSCNSRCRGRTPTVREASLRGGAISPDLSMAPM